MPKKKLFCFPYAGGSAMVYNSWKQFLDPAIELVPVELAGRGRRIHEPLYDDMNAAVDDLLRVIGDGVKQAPYALFGHSLGGYLVYELALRIREEGLPAPAHIFFSGKGAPGIKNDQEKMYHHMTEDEFRKEVLSLGGTPPEFFEHPELVDLLMPMLRNDFRLSETEIRQVEPAPLDEHITIFLGKDDVFNAEQCDGWKKRTTQGCNIHYFDGGHFFLHEAVSGITQTINRTLA